MFSNAYTQRRVFVTGHTGFKGTWLSTWLLELGAHVAGFSLDIPTQPSAYAALGLGDKITHYQGDVRDAAALSRALQAFQPHIIFHMAAQALVRPSYEEPAATFATNAMGTLHLLEAARHLPELEALICITSDKCYRNDEWVFGYRESDHLGGNDPYSASKACAELIAHAYFQSFFHGKAAVATVRAGNVIGGGDWAADRIVPDCARAWAAREAVLIRNPSATRPWQHVLEPLSGYLWLGAQLVSDATQRARLNKEAFNFGPPADVNATVAQIVEGLQEFWPDFQASMGGQEQHHKHESTLLKLCCDKALALLAWKAILPLRSTIRLTAEWYKTFYEQPANPQAAAQALYRCTQQHIEEYTIAAQAADLVWAK